MYLGVGVQLNYLFILNYKVMKLTAQNVESVLTDCLFKDGEDTTNYVKAECVMMKIGFNPERLEGHKENIEKMLKQLPKEFMKDGGGGYSFLNACVTAEGEEWGGHSDIDNLLCLGIAAGKAKIQLPREMWSAFPGGMPYFVVN